MAKANHSGKAAYAGPTPAGERNGLGVLVERCPTCGGTGKVVDCQAVPEALRSREDYQRLQFTAYLQVLELTERALAAIPHSPQEAAQLAGRARELADHAGLETVQGRETSLLRRLRQIREQHPKVSWEELRRVAVQLVPSLGNYSHWRAFRMACLRAGEPDETAEPKIWMVKRAWRKGKGWVPLWTDQAPEYLPGQKSAQEETKGAQVALSEPGLTKSFSPGLASAYTRWMGLQEKADQLQPVSRDLLGCILRHIQRGQREHEARGTVSRETLNQINSLLGVVESWELGRAEGESASGH